MMLDYENDDLMKSLLDKDLFQFGVPLLKSFQVEANGDILVEGIASVPKQDHQGEDLDPRGFELGYFQKSGWLKWEHKGVNNGPAAPNQFIGEPVEARITPEGEFYLKARIYKDSQFADQIRDQLEMLEKSQSTRKMGFSIEGQALQRDPKNPLKVLKAIIRNVVLTMNPVNDGTWVTLCKSLASSDALGMELEEDFSIEKALGTAEAAALIPQHIEGNTPDDEDETVKALRTFRSYVKRLTNKNLSKSLIDTDTFGIVQGAYDHAADCGMDHKTSLEFAQYVHQNKEILKSVPTLVGQGGAGLMKLAQILGESVDELEKSLQVQTQPTEEEELDELIKSLEAGDGNEEEEQPEDNEETEDDDVEKSLDNDLEKSLTDDSKDILDVSGFLQDLVKSINGSLGNVNGAVGALQADQVLIGQGIAVMAKAMKAQGELIKSLQGQVEELGATPRGRRSAVTPAEVQSVQRQGGTVAPAGDELSKSQVLDMLGTGVDNNKIALSTLVAFESGYGIPEEDARRIGIDPARHSKWIAR